jgi:hypothetical protein
MRPAKKLEQKMDGVLVILNSIDFNFTPAKYMIGTTHEFTHNEGQSNNSIKDKIKVARELLQEMSKECE